MSEVYRPDGRLDPAFASKLRDYADPARSYTWKFNDKLNAALLTVAPDELRPRFQQDVLGPLLLMGIDDLRRNVLKKGEVSKEQLLSALEEPDLNRQLIYIAHEVGEHLNGQANFQESFMLEPEQGVRIARHTSWAQPVDLRAFQHDSIANFFPMTNLMLMGITRSAVEKGMIQEENINLRLFADMMKQSWFKRIILGNMNTGNGFFGPISPTKDQWNWDEVGPEGIREQTETAIPWWDIKGELPEGPVSISPVLQNILDVRKTEQNQGVPAEDALGFVNEELPTNGCPIRHGKARYSSDPRDISYLSEQQLERLTGGDEPLMVRDPSDPTVLHVRFSINRFLLDQYANAIEKVA